MADTKISALTALTGANVEHAADSIPIVDDSVTTTKRILVSELANALTVNGTEQASTSGTAITFTSIPAWVKRITIQFVGVSLSGDSDPMVQIGDSGGLETSGYLGCASAVGNAVSTAADNSITSGFLLTPAGAAAAVWHGHVTLTLEDAANFTWVCSGVIGRSDAASTSFSAGSKSLSAALDRVSVTTVGGSNTFDAGAINILYD